MLVENPKGNFRFIPGRAPYSLGAVADDGYEVVHAAFHPLPRLDAGFDLVEGHLRALGRPLNALCGMELRIPKALSRQGFEEFNRPYIEKLKCWGLHVQELNSVARTNVAFEVAPSPFPCVFGFSYTAPSNRKDASFVLSGTPDVKFGASGERDSVAAHELSSEGMRQKLAHVLEGLNRSLREIDGSWTQATVIGLYTVHDVHALVEKALFPAIPGANIYGLRWYYTRPPVVDSEFEMDARCVFQEIVLPA